MSQLTIKERMSEFIAQSKGEVFLRSEFSPLGSQSQVGQVLRDLLKAGMIVRLGYGVYAKARPSTLSGKPVPRVTLEELTQEALIKLGVEPKLGRAQMDYLERRTTQMPVHTTFNTGRRRISRKITVGGRSARYERD